MARASMATIITRVRELIGDTSVDESDEPNGQFTDDQIEAALDRRRTEWSELALLPIRSRTAEGGPVFLRWIAERSPWEDGAVVLDASFVPVSAGVTANPTDGAWVFAETQDHVYVSGTTFDVYGAAADLLDQWIVSSASAATASGGTIVEWETDGQRVKRSGSTGSVTEERRALASQYRAMSLPIVSTLSRSDMRGEQWA